MLLQGMLIVSANSQQARIDSLHAVLHTAKEDTAKVNTLYKLAVHYTKLAPDTCMIYLNQSYSLALKLNYKKGIADNLYSFGLIHSDKSDYEKALPFLHNSLAIREELKDKSGIAECFNLKGTIYTMQGDYEKAIEYLNKGLALRKEIKDLTAVAESYNNLGNVASLRSDYAECLKYYLEALKIYTQTKNKERIPGVQCNIGIVYTDLNDFPRALDYLQQALNSNPGKYIEGNIYTSLGILYASHEMYDKAEENFLTALKLHEKFNNKSNIARALSNVGEFYSNTGKYEKALKYFFRCLKLSEEIGDTYNVCRIIMNISKIHLERKDFKTALEYEEKGLSLATELGIKDWIGECYNAFSEIYQGLGNYEKSLEYYKLYTDVKDSLFSKEKTQSIAEMQTRYETEKKEKEIQLLTKDKELKEKSFKEQQIIRTALISVLTLLFILSGVLYKRYRYKQKANLLLEKQKKEIQQKNKHITDSINYAKTIQEAILPSSRTFKSFFPQSFIFHKPKAIVSGDFYWMAQKDDKIICAVADCTGHGVPGAFMSLLGNNILDNVVKKMDVTEPALVLEYLNEAIIAVMAQGKENSAGSGMDIALISFDRSLRRMEYAGARNPIYLVRKGNLLEIKPDKASIGFSQKEPTVYLKQVHELEEGDLIYLFSDGYPDQMGGTNGRKFYYQPFKELLLSIHELEMQEQQKKLNEALTAWQGNYEQTDDILVIGIRC